MKAAQFVQTLADVRLRTLSILMRTGAHGMIVEMRRLFEDGIWSLFWKRRGSDKQVRYGWGEILGSRRTAHWSCADGRRAH